MFQTSVAEILATERDVHGEGWKSRRLMLAREGAPYSVHETVVSAGSRLRFTYRAHRETVYCIRGEATVEDVTIGARHALTPGSLYSVGIGEDHIVSAITDVTFLCIFDPPLEGSEEAD
jgi:L-ectoine synthase